MKKVIQTLALGLTALLTLGLTSCDDDQDTAYYLAGQWHGSIYDGNRSYDATFCFYQYDDYSTSGTGWETDRGWYNYSQAPFHWWVRNGEIFIQYDDNSNLRVWLKGNIPHSRYDDEMHGFFVDDRTGETLAEYDLYQTMDNGKPTVFETTNN